MEKNETLEKIKNGTIRIEKGKLTGLGVVKHSISISALDELIDAIGKEGLIEGISNVITSIAQLQGYFIEYEDCAIPPNLTELIAFHLKPTLPDNSDIYCLSMILKFLNK